MIIIQILKKEGNSLSTQGDFISKPQTEYELLLRNQTSNKDEVINRIQKMEDDLKAPINVILDVLSKLEFDHSLDKSYMNIQKLDSYLFDPTINTDFATKVRHDIVRLLALYGYKILDFTGLSDSMANFYFDIELVDGDMIQDIEVESRAIVDKNMNTVVKGKVYIYNSDKQ